MFLVPQGMLRTSERLGQSSNKHRDSNRTFIPTLLCVGAGQEFTKIKLCRKVDRIHEQPLTHAGPPEKNPKQGGAFESELATNATSTKL